VVQWAGDPLDPVLLPLLPRVLLLAQVHHLQCHR